MVTDALHDHYNQPLEKVDALVSAAIDAETHRQANQIELIASENLVSRAVLQAQGSVMTNKTVEGYPGHRYYGGAEFADQIETAAIERAKSVFGCEFANVQPHSGSNANQAAYLACLKPGDTILSMNTTAGGHISHGHPATLTGRVYTIQSYGLNPEDETIDYSSVEQLALEHKPKLIIAGGSAYSRTINFAAIADVARRVNAVFMVDMAHFAGLVATGLHPNPFPHADIVTTTTYKSLRGARGGLLLWNDESLTSKLNNAVFPGVQGSVMLHSVAGKAVCLLEAQSDDFMNYNRAVIDNAQALAQTLIKHGIRVVSGGTDTGLMLVDLRALSLTGAIAVDSLERAGLTCNKNQIPFDPLPAETASGLRLSVNAGTARGFGVSQFTQIGQWIGDVLQALTDPQTADQTESAVREQIARLCENYPIYT